MSPCFRLSWRHRLVWCLAALGLSLPAAGLAAESAETSPDAPLTLDVLIRDVLARHPTAASARSTVEAAAARAEGAGSLMDPMATYMMAPLSIGSHHGYGQTIRLSQKLPFFGKRGAEKDAARAEVALREAEELTAHEALAMTAAARFADLYALHHALKIHREHRALLVEIRQSAEARYRAGLAPQFAALEAEMALAQLDAEELQHDGMRTAMIAELNALLGRPPNAPLPPPEVEVALEDALPVPPSTHDHSTVVAAPTSDVPLEQRPELLAIEAEEARAEAQLARAKRESFPDFELMGEYSSMWAEPSHRLMVGVGIEIPLQLGRRKAMREEAQAMISRARHERERLEDEVRGERGAAAARLQAARARAGVQSRQVLPVAKSRVDATRAAFLTGQASLSELLDAERAQRDAEITFHEALAEVVRRRAELRRAEGTLAQSPEISR